MTSQTLQIDGLHQLALTTADLERSTRFYRDILGLSLITSFDPPGLAFFQVGNLRLSIQKVDKVEAASSVLYFRVQDIGAATQSLKDNAIELERKPELIFRDDQGQFGEAGEEEWMAFFRDPDGHLLALASRSKP
ncbi:MAG: VOC family protein [Proteobacteria bacterium]|nr:VOC family protein [Pseudomonadota bacterium]